MARYQGIATQLYVWGQRCHQEGKSFEENLDAILNEVASAGFDGFESNLTLAETDAKQQHLGQLLEKHDLKLSSLYSGGVFHDPEEAPRTIEGILPMAERAAALGCPGISLNPASVGRDKTDRELVVQGEYLDSLGQQLRNMGLFLACHNHTPEIRQNARELRAICAYTTPIFVGLCVDVDWVRRGGEDPMALMREYPDRIRNLHLRNSREGVWMETFGDGDIDYHAVHRFLQDIGYQGWLIVELAYEEATEVTRPLAENAARSYRYASEVFELEERETGDQNV